MKKTFEVSLRFVTYGTIFVEADDQEQAQDIALSEEILSGFAVESGEWEVASVDEVDVPDDRS
jgi:hypothetical protein